MCNNFRSKLSLKYFQYLNFELYALKKMDSAKSDGFDRESADIYVSAHQTKQFTTLYLKKIFFLSIF